MITVTGNCLERKYNGETVRIEPWGKNSFRVRITRLSAFPEENWALLPQQPITPEFQIRQNDQVWEQQVNAADQTCGDSAAIKNGQLCAGITAAGKLRFSDSRGKVLLEEFEADGGTPLHILSRSMKSGNGGNFQVSLKFAADPAEKLFGMGQYQNGIYNLKGSFLELAQRNSQSSVPFLLSSRGYGFFWNNPAIGRASFGCNLTEWEACSTKVIDFWITTGNSPAEIQQNYMNVTGKPPKMPEYGLGFWQCKLRYQTQDELLEVAREYHRRGIHLDMIIADFFHWTLEGTWAFDPTYWPDPAAMVRELNEMGTRLMVSVWPTVSCFSPNYQTMKDQGYLVQTESGVPVTALMLDPTSFADFTNPAGADFVWEQLEKNYYRYGIKDFWLDVAEPEYSSYDYENYRYFRGSVLETGNQYPVRYSKMIWDGLHKNGEKDVVSLVRCAWAGSQRYGTLAWSGDIPSTFESLRKQIVSGMQMGIAGIPWWNTDIGGFSGGNVADKEFQELLIRWFQYGTFCPVMRLHGYRHPWKPSLSTVGGGRCCSGADNEIWSYGEANCGIMEKYIGYREQMRPYTRQLMEEASRTGAPLIRALFYEFPEDAGAWEVPDEYLFGSRLLVAPVTEYLQRSRKVYLPAPAGWTNAFTGEHFSGGQTVRVDAPLDVIPLFIRSE